MGEGWSQRRRHVRAFAAVTNLHPSCKRAFGNSMPGNGRKSGSSGQEGPDGQRLSSDQGRETRPRVANTEHLPGNPALMALSHAGIPKRPLRVIASDANNFAV